MAIRYETYGEVPSVSWVTGSHHIFSVKHLLRELRNSHSAILLAALRSQGCKSNQEKVKTGERNEIYSHFPQVRVELTGELR